MQRVFRLLCQGRSVPPVLPDAVFSLTSGKQKILSHKRQMARPVAGFPFPCQNGSVLRQTERGNGIRPTVSDKQNIPRDASAAGRVFLPCPAGGNCLHTAAFLVEKAQHAVKLTDNGKAAVRKRDWLARPAALGQRNDLGLPCGTPPESGKRYSRLLPRSARQIPSPKGCTQWARGVPDGRNSHRTRVKSASTVK